eukprot:gene208-823_t
MVVIDEKKFLSGVIEGFYGRPWTCKQRNDLFERLKKLGMNTYVYAPKDDVKHRAFWRKLYTSEEEAKLGALISGAKAAGITFVYAISPGLDIVFSCAADVAALKRKMKQVSKLGCRSFAILFDDIDPRLKPPDSNIYKSSGDAQAILSNELFSYLKKPRFLFCPTEYCKTRAFPTIDKSEYLNTIGMNLHPDIEFLWTGDKVISQEITTESILELSKVIRRKPIIWDNIHANDYDHRRVFLGPYSGRPIELYKHLNGVLTNPNCEFEANYIAIHTFATWCQLAANSMKPASNGVTESNIENCDLNDCVPMDVQIDDNVVIAETEEPVQIDLYPLTPADINSVVTGYDPMSALKLAIQDWLVEFGVPKSVELKSYAKRHNVASTCNGQTVYTGNYGLDITNGQDETMVDASQLEKSSQLTCEDLGLLVDLFFMPYEHGNKAKSLLEEFKWLKENSYQADKHSQLFNDKETSWKVRAAHFHSNCHMVADLFVKICRIPNESILYDLYPYVWDVNEAVLALDSYVSWLASSDHKQVYVSECLSPEPSPVDIRANGFQPEDFIEAWHVKYIGGIVVAMHRLLPFDGGYNFLDMAPDSPTSDIYHVRPFHETDKDGLYKLCSVMESSSDILDIEDEFHGDNRIGAYLDICAKSVFIVEHNGEICGYVAAAPNNKLFSDKAQSGWVPFMNQKYQKSINVSNSFTRPTDWYLESNSHLEVHMETKIKTARVMRRVLAMVLSVLKSLGSAAVYMELRDERELDMYSKLGFQAVSTSDSKVVLTRTL